MTSHTNNIDISKLPFDTENIKSKGVQYYKDKITKIIKDSAKNAETLYTKPSLKMDF